MSVSGNMISDDGDVMTGWCAQGLGLIVRSTWHVNPLIRQGVLRQVLELYPHPTPTSMPSTPPPPRHAAGSPRQSITCQKVLPLGSDPADDRTPDNLRSFCWARR